MKTIWKQELMIGVGEQTYRLPFGCELLHLDMQYGKPCIWFEVDPDNDPVDYTFHTVGTGHEIDFEAQYVGTYLAVEGQFVGHVYAMWDY